MASSQGEEFVDDRRNRAINIRCDPSDRRGFKAAAKAEGFSTVTQWMLFHLRRQMKKTLEPK